MLSLPPRSLSRSASSHIVTTATPTHLQIQILQWGPSDRGPGTHSISVGMNIYGAQRPVHPATQLGRAPRQNNNIRTGSTFSSGDGAPSTSFVLTWLQGACCLRGGDRFAKDRLLSSVVIVADAQTSWNTTKTLWEADASFFCPPTGRHATQRVFISVHAFTPSRSKMQQRSLVVGGFKVRRLWTDLRTTSSEASGMQNINIPDTTSASHWADSKTRIMHI